MQYDGHTGITAGMDFTRYSSPSFQNFRENRGQETLTDMQNNSKQNISQWALFTNHTHTFATGWTLNYGVHGGYTSSKTYIDYLYNKGYGYEPDPDLLEIIHKRNTRVISLRKCLRISESIFRQPLH